MLSGVPLPSLESLLTEVLEECLRHTLLYFHPLEKILIKNVPQVLKFSQTVPEVSSGYISLSVVNR